MAESKENIGCKRATWGGLLFNLVTNNIREIREQRGIYQDDLAAAIGFSTKTVGRIERGDSTPSAEFMLQISKYFNLLVEDVFHVED